MSDTTIKKTRVNGVLYDLGGGSGVQIVDALPAEGEEGSIYLLRKSTERPGGFKARGYYQITGSMEPGEIVLVTDDFTAQDLQSEIYRKLHIDPSNFPAYINIDELNNMAFNIPVITEEMFNQVATLNNFIIIETEEDLPSTNQNRPVFQDLGEITVDSFEFSQDYEVAREGGGTSYIYVENVKNSLLHKTEVNSSTFIVKNREISYNEIDELVIGEWMENFHASIAESLVDQIITDLNALQQLGGDIAYIKCSPTPAGYDYSYTEYVFDQGVYTEITAGGGNEGTGISGAYLAPGCLLEADYYGFDRVTIDPLALIEQLEKAGVNVDEPPFLDANETYVEFALGFIESTSLDVMRVSKRPIINITFSITSSGPETFNVIEITFFGEPYAASDMGDFKTNSIRSLILEAFDFFLNNDEEVVGELYLRAPQTMTYINNVVEIYYESIDSTVHYFVPDMTEFCSTALVEYTSGSDSGSGSN